MHKRRTEQSIRVKQKKTGELNGVYRPREKEAVRQRKQKEQKETKKGTKD